MARTSCDSAYHCRDGYPCQSCRSVLECPAPKMCGLSTEDQYVCQSNHGIAEAVTGVLGGAQFSSGPLYHPRSSRGRFGHPREAAVGAGNFPDSNGISDDCKRQNRFHQTEPAPPQLLATKEITSRDTVGISLLLFYNWFCACMSYIPGKSRGERPSPYEVTRLPLNMMECEIFKATS